MFFGHYHNYHLIDNSPWPLFGAISALYITVGAVSYFHFYQNSLQLVLLGLFCLILVLGFWWRDVIREGTFLGHHTKEVQRGLRLGMMLFIVSEVMFFVAFFWAYFHSALAPSIEIGSVWPPVGITPFNPFKIPLLNTIILLSSGATITLAHHALIADRRELTIQAFGSTISLAVLFTALQIFEYIKAPFTIADSVYGSTFFMSTGFHGFHVIIGTIFIFVGFIRYVSYHFTPTNHFGFEASAWYWHFVDVVWLFLYLVIYIWGGYKI